LYRKGSVCFDADKVTTVAECSGEVDGFRLQKRFSAGNADSRKPLRFNAGNDIVRCHFNTSGTCVPGIAIVAVEVASGTANKHRGDSGKSRFTLYAGKQFRYLHSVLKFKENGLSEEKQKKRKVFICVDEYGL
jgi:hypothetical protein